VDEQGESTSSNSSWVVNVAIAGVVAIILAVLLWPANQGGGPSLRSMCLNNIKQVALALHEYHDDYGCFPPAYIADESGRPMHSWRVLILPYLDDQDLYEAYRFDETWDGPNNRKLHDVPLNYGAFRCPTEDDVVPLSDTNYLAVVGAETMWPGDRGISIPDVKDGTSTTIFVVEVHNSGIHWMEPRDLDFDTMSFAINDPQDITISSQHGLGSWNSGPGGANGAMADGSVLWFPAEKEPGLIRSLLTAAGGESLPDG